MVVDDIGVEHACCKRSRMDNLLVGDRVIWSRPKYICTDQESDISPLSLGVVERRLPRHSLLERPDHRGKMRGMVANISQVIVVISGRPVVQQNFIDRYLVAIENAMMQAVVVLNKVDIDEHWLIKPRTLLAIYRRIGYPCFELSAHTGFNLQLLRQQLQGQQSIFVGLSGTGKSSLINQLVTNANAKVGDISVSNDRGCHTTTQTQYYVLRQYGGGIMDSPGIREFGLDHFDHRQLRAGFTEFHRLSKLCRFRNCNHCGEPECAVEEATLNAEISVERLRSYRYLYTQVAISKGRK